MSKKASTTTQTVEIPPEVREQYKHLIASGNQLAQKPFQAYSEDPTAFVAPLTSTQQAGIANINAMQGMAQPSIEQGQNMIMQGIGAGAPLQYQSLDTAAQGRGMGTALFGESLNTAGQGQAIGGQLFGESLGTVGAGQATGGQLFGESLGTAAAGTGAAGDIYGQALPAIQQAVETGAAYGAGADPYLRSALGAASPLMSKGAGLTTAGLGAGAGYGALAADYLGRGTQAVDPTAFSGEEIDKYMSPYMKNVVEAQQALQAEEAAAQRSALKGQAIAAGAFGGDRGGIAQANLARQQSLANQATLANLLQGGYGQALGAFQQQQATRLAAEQANRAAQQFGSQQAAALGQQLFGQNLAAGSQLANIGQALFGQNITQGQALANLGQQLYAQGLGGAQAAAGIGTNIAQMKAQEAALQQQAAQGVFGQAAQTAALQQQAAQGVFGQAAQTAALQQQAAQGVFGQAAQEAALQQAASQNLYNMGSQGGMNIANLGIAGQGAALQGAQAQLAAGQIEQQTEQAAKSAMYNQFLQQQGYPFQTLGFLGNLSMGIGSQSGGTTTTQQGSYSDRRLKEDVRKVGETFDGQPIYSFKYKGEDKSQLGLIAQEVEKSHPEAVGERNGFLTVDYHDATDEAAKRGHFATGGLVPSRLGGAVMEPGDYARGGYAGGGDVASLYQSKLGRPGSADEHAYWQERIDSGEMTLADVENAISNSEEGKKYAASSDVSKVDPRIASLYDKYFFRQPDAAGAKYWQDALNSGTPIEDIEAGIANSRERQVVNQKPLTYNAANFGTPAAPTKNRYGFYSAAPSGSSFTPEAVAARKEAAAAPAATGKGPATSSYTPPARYGSYTPPPPAASGKGPSTSGYTPSTPSYTPSYSSPAATGKGPSTNAYTGTANRGYSGTPTATGKGPSSYASGGRVAYANGGVGASDLKDYIDTLAGSPKGLAMAHKAILGPLGGMADVSKFSEGMLKGVGRSNIPQPGRIPERKDPIKEAAEFGTNVSKIAEFGSNAKKKIQEWTAAKEPPKPEGSSTETVKPTGTKVSEGATTEPKTELAGGYKRPDDLLMRTSEGGGGGDMMASTKSAAQNTFDGGFGSNLDNASMSNLDMANLDLPVSDLSGLEELGSFLARGGRIHKQFAGGVFGKQEDEGSSDPSEGAYKPIGPEADIEFKPQTGGGSFVKDATQRLLKGGTGGGGGGGGGSLLGTVGQAVSLGTAAFKVGTFLAEFLPMIISDERLKKHAKPIGRLYDGQTVYRYDIDGETKIGLLAQEVEKKEPDAVGLAGKYKAVDYELATAKAAKRGHFYGGGGAFDVAEGDPSEKEIKVAGLSPSQSMTMDDASFKDSATSPDPVTEAVASIAPTARASDVTGGLKPPDDRHADVFGKMLQNESRGRQFDEKGRLVVGKAGEEGISQIRPGAAKEAAAYLGVEYDPERVRTDKEYNMQLGKAYFNMQLDRFGGDPIIAAAAYNAGPGRVTAALKKAEEQGGDYLDHLPITTVKYLSNLSDAALGAHQRLLERQRQVEEKSGEGRGPAVVNATKPGLAGGQQTAAAEPGLGAGLGPKRDWDLVGSKILPDAVPKSADFWVPLIAAVGGMLGARAPNLANAIGAGLTAGASAYMKREEFAQEAMKNSLALIKDRFVPNYENDAYPWFDKMMNRPLTADEYSKIISQFPGMPRIEPTMAPTSKAGLGVSERKEPAAAPAGGLAPAGEGKAPAGGLAPPPAKVEPPKVEAPSVVTQATVTTPGETAAAPAAASAAAPAGERKAEAVRPKLEIPTFESQTDADAWVMANMDRVFEGAPPLLDPRTYIKRAEVEGRKEEIAAAKLERLRTTQLTRGGDSTALNASIVRLEKEYTDAQTQRQNAEEKARALITGATAMAMERSKQRMLGEEAVRTEKGKREVIAGTTLRERQDQPGGPTTFDTEARILDEVNKNNGANPSSDRPNPTNASPSSAVIAKQPEFIQKRMEAVDADERKMVQDYTARKQLKSRVSGLMKIIEDFQTGALAGRKADAVRYAKALGFDVDESAFDTANPAAFQKFRYYAVNGLIDDAKKLTGSISDKDVGLLRSANLDAELEPEAVAFILGDIDGWVNYENKFVDDYMDWRRANPTNPYPERDFTLGWHKKDENKLDNFKEEAIKGIAFLGQKIPDDPSKLVHGQKYRPPGSVRSKPGYYDARTGNFIDRKPPPLD